MKNFVFIAFLLCLGLTATAQSQRTQLEKAEIVKDLRVYPNPSTNGNFSVSFLVPQFQETITIKVYNLIGKEVYQKKLNVFQGQFDGSVDIAGYSKGVYILEISSGENKQIKRLSFI